MGGARRSSGSCINNGRRKDKNASWPGRLVFWTSGQPSPRSIFASSVQFPTMTNDRHVTIRKGSALIGLLLSLLAPAANSLSLNMITPSSATAARSLSRSRFLSSTAGSLFVAASASAAALVGDPEECAARDLLKGVPGYGGGSVGVGDNPRYLDQELEMKYGEGENYM